MNTTYTVKAGDTLYGISNQFGVSVSDLAALNKISNNIIRVGQVLTIPNVEGTNPSDTFTYTVKRGDTLYKIANIYKTTVDEIVRLNNLKSTSLSIGQELKIPENYDNMDDITLPEFKTYTVKKGDSLYSIAKSNNTTVDTLISDNALKSNVLSIGQTLKIRLPGGTSKEVEECFGPDFEVEDASITYTVKRGDNLYNIAKNYNTSVSAIVNLNNLKSTSLSIGQILKIPSTTTSGSTTYTVQKGDSLYKIAQKFNTTVDSIKNKNNLKSNILSIGQKLII